MSSPISVGLRRLEELATGRLSPKQMDELAEQFLDQPHFEELTSFIAQQPGTLLDNLRQLPRREGSKVDLLANKILQRVSELASANGAFDNTRSEPGDLNKITHVPASDSSRVRRKNNSELLERLDSFQIKQVLGKGGMGTVYLADDTRLDRPVAIKTLNREIASQPGAVERFLREARTAAKIEHDHICPIYQVGEDQGVPFIAMPLLRGEPLDALMRRGLPLPVAEALRIGREIALGLSVAHEAGLIHRDIKPANIWLETMRDGPPRVRILDFGLARATKEENEITELGAVIGTPAYMSPEQARGRKLDARADLWSLGVILYEMTTGKRPFTGPDVMAMLTSIAVDEPEAPRALNPQTPAELSQLILRLLSKKAELRPASGRQVAEQLQQIRMFATLPEIEALPADESGPAVVGPSAHGISSSSNNTWGALDDPIPTASVVPAERHAQKSIPVALLAALLILPVAGLAGAAVFLMKNKSRDEANSQVEAKESPKETKPATAPGEAKTDPPSAYQFKKIPVGESPLDKLDPKFIPVAERADWQPNELVAVIGSQARTTWGGAHRIAMSPDGRYVCLASNAETSIWDTGTQQRIGHFLDGPEAFQPSFSDDGQTLYLHLSQSAGFTIDLTARPLVRKPSKHHIPAPGYWSFQRRIENGHTLIGLTGKGDHYELAIVDVSGDLPSIREKRDVLQWIQPCIYCGPNGEFIYQSPDRILHRALIKNAKVEQQFETAPLKTTMRGFTGKTNQVLLADKDSAGFWELTGPRLKKMSQFKENPAGASLLFSADGRWMVISNGGSASIWRVDGMEPKHVGPFGPANPINGQFAIDGSGNLAVLSAFGGFVHFFDLNGNLPVELSPIDPSASFLTAFTRPEGDITFDASSGRLSLNRFDVPSGKNQRRQIWSLDGEQPQPGVLIDTINGGSVLSLGQDRWLHLNDDATGSRIYRHENNQITPVSESFGGLAQTANVSSDGKLLIMSSVEANEPRWTAWDLSEDKPQRRWSISREDSPSVSIPVVRFLVSKDHQWFTAFQSAMNSGEPWSLAVWRNGSEKPRPYSTFPVTHSNNLVVAFSPDGQHLVHNARTPGLAEILKLNNKNHAESGSLGASDGGTPLSLAFHPDGKKISIAGYQSLTIYDLDTRKAIWTCRFPGTIPWHDWAADGRHLVAQNANMTCYVLRFTERVSSNDPHRKAAEVILGRGGSVEILDQGKTTLIKDAKSLPDKLLKLRSIRLNIPADAPALTREELALLEPIDWLQEISLGGKITQANLATLAGFPLANTTRRVELAGEELTDDVFVPLSRFKSLSHITIAAPRVTSRGLRLLKGGPLTGLTLRNAPGLRDEDLAHLKDLPNLTSLNLENSPLGDAGLRHIAKAARLRELFISGCDRVTNAGIAELVQCRELTRLDFQSASTTPACLESLGKLSKLVRLNNGNDEKNSLSPTDAELAKLAGLSKLEAITIRPGNLTDAAVETLAKFKSLESINLTGSRLTEEGVRRLQTALPTCKIFWEKPVPKKG